MMALVDDEGIGKRRHVDLIGAEQIYRVEPAIARGFEDGGDIEPAFARDEADVEAADPGGGKVEHVEAVPAIGDHAGLFGDPARRRQNLGAVGPGQGALTDDQHRMRGVVQNPPEGMLTLRDLAKRLGAGAEPFGPVGQIRLRPDDGDREAAREIAFAKAGVDQRRLEARVGADQ